MLIPSQALPAVYNRRGEEGVETGRAAPKAGFMAAFVPHSLAVRRGGKVLARVKGQSGLQTPMCGGESRSGANPGVGGSIPSVDTIALLPPERLRQGYYAGRQQNSKRPAAVTPPAQRLSVRRGQKRDCRCKLRPAFIN